ncbi:GntR family transcriptional regulator [Prosthecomicrobium hirschii]|uniref:GntR family transcriptional regulator n=1 Tax=Prosthecodimorpha hirschii TaxID=665126 RepID=A0A0P6VIH8_9HYPH|nr:GntR family transcriptional regulator [Prosthecomicrobium hirschii]KPL51925.1 GntR family transcriptional regulator [Prosthecomicrobium hirschii]MCW1843725.1 GntR family transcriptional regulator [Prosthecomicrobium hirschii]TPQ51809.1 GntR family transcriptional regulator [Prosthecomicrobium hirschii]
MPSSDVRTAARTAGPDSLRVDRPAKTLRELTLVKMREAILTQHFRPGDRLVERELCEQLGVSRTIVREVLRHLETEGLVTTLQARGPIVSRTSAAEALQIYEIRGALEGIAARACAELGDAAVAADLDAAIGRIRTAYRGKDMAGVLEATSEFYGTLFSASGKDIAWSIVSSLTVRINHLRSMTIKTPGRDQQGPEQMQRIVDAIRAGDGAAAETAALQHVRAASDIARRLLAADDAV